MIEDLRKDIERLVALYENEKKRGDDLASSLALSQSEIKELKQRNAELTDKLRKLEIANAFASKDTSFEAKSSIDRIIRQIDQCIKLIED